MFRNLTLFRFPVIDADAETLAPRLADCALKPVGPLEMLSRGFVSPLGRGHDEMAVEVSNAVWLSVGTEERLLPAAALNAALARKLDEIEEREGRRPGGRARRRLKDDLVVEMLPRALVKPSRLDCYLDHALGVLVVDTASRKAAEDVASEIRRALGSFPALPLNAEVAPRAVLTGWLAGDPLPEGLSLGDEAELEDPAGDAKVRLTRHELRSDEVARHLEAGKQCVRLAMTFADRVSFTLGEDLVIRKFKLLDGAVDALESTEREDIRAELNARFALLIGEVRALFAVIETALRISKVEG